METIQIAFFGATNSGKSTLVNALSGQKVSLVSDLPGTTTDPVRKRIELPGIGPCVLVDTAGCCDDSPLGAERDRLTRAVLDNTDIAVVLVSSQDLGRYQQNTPLNAGNGPILGTIPALDIPIIRVMTKADLGGSPPSDVLAVSAVTGQGIPELLERIAAVMPEEEERFLTGDLVKSGDSVLMVMPQDSEAPKGRLIIPQVQVLRELLDRGCIPVCCTPDKLQEAMEKMSGRPKLTITDSQVFKIVDETIPKDWPLTSFSVLLAASKGDIQAFVEGAKAISRLKSGDRVLIAEACTHVPAGEDIGRVKIPALLQRAVGAGAVGRQAVATRGFVNGRGPATRLGGMSEAKLGDPTDSRGDGALQIDIAAGNDFPEDLSRYSLIIHCGACVATKTLVRSRIKKALRAGVPITNYGIAIAALQGILSRIRIPKQSF